MPYIQLLEKSIRSLFNSENKLLQPQTNSTEPKLQSVHKLMGHPVLPKSLLANMNLITAWYNKALCFLRFDWSIRQKFPIGASRYIFPSHLTFSNSISLWLDCFWLGKCENTLASLRKIINNRAGSGRYYLALFGINLNPKFPIIRTYFAGI